MKGFLNYRLLTVIAVVFIIMGVMTSIYIFTFSDEIIETSALQDAELEIKALAGFRSIYTKEVIEKAKKSGLNVSHDFIGKEGTIPLPASMTKMIGKSIGEGGTGSEAFLYSAYPFPWRIQTEGLNDQFRRDAWSYLNQNPEKPFSRIENVNGNRVLRFAKADKMRADCIHCHNTHPDTPKNDWKLNDVRGILEVHRPLDTITFHAHKKARNISLIVIATSILGIFLSVLAAIIIRNDKKSQAQVMHFSKLASLGEMAGGIAHEINNPLAIISSSIQMLKKANDMGKLNDELLNYVVGNIDSTVNRAMKIVSGLRTVSRESTGDTIEPILLRDLFTDIMGLCSEKFKNNGVRLDINLDSQEFDNKVMGDRVQLSQVFINLFGNSYDAIEKLEEKWITVEVISEDKFQKIIITDSGKGIPEKVQEKMFNPLFTSKPIGKGTGLGLSISKNIISKYGGDLEFSRKSPNTCFVIKLLKEG